MQNSLPLVACSLSASGRRERLTEWKSLLAVAESREELSTGMRYRFPSALTERVRSLAAAEHECCSFLRFDLVEAGDSLVLTIEADETGQEALRFVFA
jgi:hypothetical protein